MQATALTAIGRAPIAVRLAGYTVCAKHVSGGGCELATRLARTVRPTSGTARSPTGAVCPTVCGRVGKATDRLERRAPSGTRKRPPTAIGHAQR